MKYFLRYIVIFGILLSSTTTVYANSMGISPAEVEIGVVRGTTTHESIIVTREESLVEQTIVITTVISDALTGVTIEPSTTQLVFAQDEQSVPFSYTVTCLAECAGEGDAHVRFELQPSDSQDIVEGITTRYAIEHVAHIRITDVVDTVLDAADMSNINESVAFEVQDVAPVVEVGQQRMAKLLFYNTGNIAVKNIPYTIQTFHDGEMLDSSVSMMSASVPPHSSASITITTSSATDGWYEYRFSAVGETHSVIVSVNRPYMLIFWTGLLLCASVCLWIVRAQLKKSLRR